MRTIFPGHGFVSSKINLWPFYTNIPKRQIYLTTTQIYTNVGSKKAGCQPFIILYFRFFQYYHLTYF